MWWIIPLVMVACLMFGAIGWWYHVSQEPFSTYLHAGDKYQVGQRGALRVYTLPDLPMEPEMVQRLAPEFIDRQETLLAAAHELLGEQEVMYWLNDTTLQAFERQGCTMPTDDSLCLAVPWQHREYLWSAEFARAAATHELEVIFLRGSTLHFATAEGAAVRLRHAGVRTPVLHIAFHKELEAGRWYRVAGWWGDDHSLHSTDICEQEWLFPPHTKTYEPSNLTVSVPRDPLAVLQQQFGNAALTQMTTRSPWISAHTPFEMFPFVWRKQDPADEAEPS